MHGELSVFHFFFLFRLSEGCRLFLWRSWDPSLVTLK